MKLKKMNGEEELQDTENWVMSYEMDYVLRMKCINNKWTWVTRYILYEKSVLVKKLYLRIIL